MSDYVLGFMFDPDRLIVNLLYKTRGPASVVDRVNGIGGKIEEGEGGLAAMVREFREETGVETTEDDWTYVALLKGRWGKVLVYSAFTEKAWETKDQPGEELLLRVGVKDALTSKLAVANLPVLLAIALDKSGIAKPVVLYDND